MEDLENNNEKHFLKGFYDKPFFNIFGIELYMDDLLLLCILFSMYKEGIKDQMLFMCLLLLLFS